MKNLKIKITESQLKKIVNLLDDEEQIKEGFLSDLYDLLSDKIKNLISSFKDGNINKTEFKKKLESEVKKDKKDKKEDVNIGDLKEFNFHQIPGGSNNWRSAQITADLLPSVIKKYKIKNIIRMSGDDEKHMGKHTKTSTDTEKKICEENNCTYHFINSHSGFKLGKGYTTSIQKTSDILSKGNTLIHCAHGADRTGGMVGAYLKNKGYMTNKDELWNYTTQYNNWQKMVNNNNFFGTGYDKYADGFYPISELKKSKWVK